MPAKMLAATARFCRTDDAKAVSGNNEMRVIFHRWHSRAIRYFKLQPGHGNHGLHGLRTCLRSICGEALGQLNQPLFKFAAENRGYAERAKIVDVHGRVQSVTAKMRARIFFSEQWNEPRRQPCGRMHR